MLDFLNISVRTKKNGNVEIYPKFVLGKKSSDLMVRGGDFYAIWVEELGLWSTDEDYAIRLIDKELDIFCDNYKKKHADIEPSILYAWDSESGVIDSFHKYCQKQKRDSFHMLDEKLIFSNTKTTKEDYASKKLSYPLEKGDIAAYDKLISTLYSEKERHKLEWAIGSIISGDSKHIQKFMVLYGEAGAGKSTVLNIIQMLFEGYYVAFEAKALASNNNAFSTEVFKNNPLVAIQHDGDLSRIEDNTKINSIVSHEEMVINEKFKASYMARMNCFLFMATNRPVKITDAKSGIIRRLIDVKPSGKKVGTKRYFELWNQIKFQLGAIAAHCLEVFQGMGKNYYSDYRPYEMMYETDVFYNFVEANYDDFARADEIGLKRAYAIYKEYCEDALVEFKLPMYKFRTELKEYFREFYERAKVDGVDVRSL